jgi:hypothetical protein
MIKTIIKIEILAFLMLIGVFFLFSSYNNITKLTEEEEKKEIKKSLDRTEQSIIEVNKILNDPYYKYKK